MDNDTKVKGTNDVKEVKKVKFLTAKQYKAFLLYCIKIQQDNFNNLDKQLDTIYLFKKKNSCSREVAKQVKFDEIKVQQAIKETKTKINNLSICLNGLRQFEEFNGCVSDVSDDYVKEEAKKYSVDEKEVEVPKDAKKQ